MEASTALARFRSLELSPARFLQLALANTFGLWLIVGSGAAVRLTDSGLGCRHWPGCERGQPLPARDVHAFVEFGNRLVGGVVITLTLVTWLAARRTPGLPGWARRVALLVFLGALAQAPLGYLAVASDLRWPVVMAHLLLSIALLAGAVVVAVEALGLRDGRSPPVVPRELRLLALVFTRGRLRAHRQRHVRHRRRAAFRAAASTSTASGSSTGRVYLHGAVVGLFLLSFLFAIGYLAAYRDRSPRSLQARARRLSGCCSCRWRSASSSGARSSRGGSFSSTSCSRGRSGRAPSRSLRCSSGRLGRCSPAST